MTQGKCVIERFSCLIDFWLLFTGWQCFYAERYSKNYNLFDVRCGPLLVTVLLAIQQLRTEYSTNMTVAINLNALVVGSSFVIL